MRTLVRRAGTAVAIQLSLLALSASAGAATTRNVPSQYATVGAAVSAASSGDTILVDSAAGPFGCENIVTNKVLTIESTGGSAKTVVNCAGNYFITAEGNGTVIRGFTFQNGTSSIGVLSIQASATVEDCAFNNNNSGYNFMPAAIYARASGPIAINNCSFTGNKGLGAVQVNGTATISNCTFSHNTGQYGAAAIYSNTATITVSHSTFDSNIGEATDPGGAVYVINGTFHFSDTTFLNNTSAVTGGAVECGSQGISSSCTFDRCIFQGNSAPYGGALSSSVSSNGTTTLTATDSLFIGNSSSSDGPAVMVQGGAVPVNVTLTNVSLFGNKFTGAPTTGVGTMGGDVHTSLTITNGILYGDTTPTEISTKHVAHTITVSHSDIGQTGYAGANGNINADPKYLAPATGNLSIPSSSPCAFTGTATGAPSADFNGATWSGGVSMGALTPRAPTSVSITAPATATAGTAFSFTVSVLDQDGQVNVSYAGTLHFTSSDSGATLPADATLTNGTGTFSATLVSAGNQTLTATDTANAALKGTSAPIAVTGVSGSSGSTGGTSGSSGSSGSSGGTTGNPDTKGGGCGCRASGNGSGLGLAALALGLVAASQRRKFQGR